VLDGANEVGFLVGTYDHMLPLVIDPVMSGTLFSIDGHELAWLSPSLMLAGSS